MVFYLVPGVLGEIEEAAWVGGVAGMVMHYVLALAAFGLTMWGFVELGSRLRGTAGSNSYGPDPLLQIRVGRLRGIQKQKKARWPSGHRAVGNLANYGAPTRGAVSHVSPPPH